MVKEGTDQEDTNDAELAFGWRDYLAIAIAMGQTVLLPFVLIVVVLLLIFLLSLLL